MEKHRQLNDIEFLQQFEEQTMAPEVFSHEAHLRLAWLHLQKEDLEQAISKVTTQILAFVTQLGAEDKFNKTLTVSAVKVVHHFKNKSNSNTFQGFIKEYPQVKNEFMRLIKCHYGFDIFNSARAKKEYVEPDLLAFS